MQTTSALYKQIVAGGGHWFETRLTIAGNEVPESEIISLDRENQAMTERKPSVGGALASQIRLTILAPSFTIPRMGEIGVFVRACNDTQQSEWLPSGVYFIDTRAHDQAANGVGLLRLTAYDAMLKGEQDYPDTTHSWPYLDRLVVAEIAAALGVTVDSRTNRFLTSGYLIDLPLGYTIRETLQHIAAAYGGNFIITAENKLLFVPLFGLDPEETLTGSYLAVDGSTDALLFGGEGWYILV